MWSEKKGDTYDATVVMEDTGEKFVKFKLEFPKKKASEEVYMPNYEYDKDYPFAAFITNPKIQ